MAPKLFVLHFVLFSIAQCYLCLTESYIFLSVGQTQIDVRRYMTLSQLDIMVDFFTSTYRLCAADWCFGSELLQVYSRLFSYEVTSLNSSLFSRICPICSSRSVQQFL